MASPTTENENINNEWGQHSMRALKSMCIPSDLLLKAVVANHEFADEAHKLQVIVDVRPIAQGDLLQSRAAYMVHIEEKVVSTCTPIDNESSNLYQAHVHVLSDAVLWLGNGACSNASQTFANRWQDRILTGV